MTSQDNGPPGGARALDLSDDERELLLKICQRYRAAIPAYLKSKEEERARVDSLIAKLS